MLIFQRIDGHILQNAVGQDLLVAIRQTGAVYTCIANACAPKNRAGHTLRVFAPSRETILRRPELISQAVPESDITTFSRSVLDFCKTYVDKKTK